MARRADPGLAQAPSSPHWALCVPLPAGAVGGVQGWAATRPQPQSPAGRHGPSWPLHPSRSTWSKHGLMCQVRCDRQGLSGWVTETLTGSGGWGYVGSWESAAAESKPLRGHFQSECQSCHLLVAPPRRPRTAPVLPADPRRQPALIPQLPKAGRKDGKLHTSVSGRLPGHLRSILPLHPRAFSPTSCSSLRCRHKDISGSKEVNACGRRRRGRGKRFP